MFANVSKPVDGDFAQTLVPPGKPKEETAAAQCPLWYRERLQSSDVGLGVMLGGSSARLIVLPLGHEDDPRLVTDDNRFQLSWPDYKNGTSCKGTPKWPGSEEFVRDFAKHTLAFLKEKGISPSRVVKIQGSIAGFVAEPGTDCAITTTNTPVRFENFSFGRSFLKALKEGDSGRKAFKHVESIPLINDGCAAAFGDILHPQGAARGLSDITTIIMGTGIGGSGVSGGRVLAARSELGHTLWYDSLEDQYVYVPLKQLIQDKLYVNGHYKELPDRRYSYFEHRLAGPWIAMHFVKEISNNGALVEALARATKVPTATLMKLEELKRSDEGRWAMQANGAYIFPVNKFILGHTYAEELFPLPVYAPVGVRGGNEHERVAHGKLIEAAVEYKRKIHRELGKALATLEQQPAFRGSTYVLVSGVAENWHKIDGANFSKPLYRACGIDCATKRIRVSPLDGSSREACGVIDGKMDAVAA
jgi:hypothetical protein